MIRAAQSPPQRQASRGQPDLDSKSGKTVSETESCNGYKRVAGKVTAQGGSGEHNDPRMAAAGQATGRSPFNMKTVLRGKGTEERGTRGMGSGEVMTGDEEAGEDTDSRNGKGKDYI